MLWLRPRCCGLVARTVLASVCIAVAGLAMTFVPVETAIGQASPVVDGQKNATAETEWPQFLGPNRNGISRETGLIDGWPADGDRKSTRLNSSH